MQGVSLWDNDGAFLIGQRSARGGPWLLPANLGWDLGCFIEDVDHLFIIYDLTAAVAEGMNAYQVFLETRYDVSASCG